MPHRHGKMPHDLGIPGQGHGKRPARRNYYVGIAPTQGRLRDGYPWADPRGRTVHSRIASKGCYTPHRRRKGDSGNAHGNGRYALFACGSWVNAARDTGMHGNPPRMPYNRAYVQMGIFLPPPRAWACRAFKAGFGACRLRCCVDTVAQRFGAGVFSGVHQRVR